MFLCLFHAKLKTKQLNLVHKTNQPFLGEKLSLHIKPETFFSGLAIRLAIPYNKSACLGLVQMQLCHIKLVLRHLFKKI